MPQLTASRIVAFIVTPILTPVAGVAAAWLAKHFPGLPHLDPAEITAFGVAGATAALGACLKWLHGQSLWERAEAWAAQHAEAPAPPKRASRAS